eukprot:TRINITY_DN2925_c0_g1_i1.p1 TRINITY_DN2925_c0_g1~~TRINITY_DN2925_c0_g1_i1.p1  ORF type:complete len:304 (-),score=69.71 TRINITY_DN2925_c0_g1_i1:68-952(-)
MTSALASESSKIATSTGAMEIANSSTSSLASASATKKSGKGKNYDLLAKQKQREEQRKIYEAEQANLKKMKLAQREAHQRMYQNQQVFNWLSKQLKRKMHQHIYENEYKDTSKSASTTKEKSMVVAKIKLKMLEKKVAAHIKSKETKENGSDCLDKELRELHELQAQQKEQPQSNEEAVIQTNTTETTTNTTNPATAVTNSASTSMSSTIVSENGNATSDVEMSNGNDNPTEAAKPHANIPTTAAAADPGIVANEPNTNPEKPDTTKGLLELSECALLHERLDPNIQLKTLYMK